MLFLRTPLKCFPLRGPSLTDDPTLSRSPPTNANAIREVLIVCDASRLVAARANLESLIRGDPEVLPPRTFRLIIGWRDFVAWKLEVVSILFFYDVPRAQSPGWRLGSKYICLPGAICTLAVATIRVGVVGLPSGARVSAGLVSCLQRGGRRATAGGAADFG